MAVVRDLALVDASVRHDATFRDAARELAGSGLSAIAVLDADGSVQGVFTQDAELRGLFPGYLGELRHTAFLGDDDEGLAERARAVRDEPVRKHLTPAPVLEAEHSRTHAAELFLHSGLAALPVVSGGRYMGMLDQRTLCDVADDLLAR
jgi:CBS domain-containing protein